MNYILKFTDNHKDECRRQEVWSDDKEESVWFCVEDLTETPEDATVSRDLFTAHEFIDAVKLGFRIAKRGFDDIEVVEEDWEE